ncbi:MAG: Sulfurtransferase [candidate division TM6 bacterium GW2011_GWF2_32_72]|nr:MAG: Sulfurtransferase [candidate division TM6 bacterium GW2011_GWF2_32_72]
MKFFNKFLLATMGLVLLPACLGFWGKKEVCKSDLLVIYVLDKEMYDDVHIKGSIHVYLEDLESFAKGLDKEQQIVVYCSNPMCSASASAWKTLNDLGFNNVWAYEDGMAGWYQAGLPCEGPATEDFLKKPIEKSEEEGKEARTISTEKLKEMMDKYVYNK